MELPRKLEDFLFSNGISCPEVEAQSSWELYGDSGLVFASLGCKGMCSGVSLSELSARRAAFPGGLASLTRFIP